MAPTLGSHLNQLQNLALKAETMLDCLLAIVDDPEQGELNLRLVESALDLVRKLNGGLDGGALLRAEA